jgi:hypothetical protein
MVSLIVEGQDSIETSGKAPIPDQSAWGSVVFTNLTDHPINIPDGTVVSTRDATVRFATSRSGSLPAGPGRHVFADHSLQPGIKVICRWDDPVDRRIFGIDLMVTQSESSRIAMIRSSAHLADQNALSDRLKQNREAHGQNCIKLKPGDVLLEQQLIKPGLEHLRPLSFNLESSI